MFAFALAALNLMGATFSVLWLCCRIRTGARVTHDHHRDAGRVRDSARS